MATPDRRDAPGAAARRRRRILLLGAMLGLTATAIGIAAVTHGQPSSSGARDGSGGSVTAPIAARFATSSVTPPRPTSTAPGSSAKPSTTSTATTSTVATTEPRVVPTVPVTEATTTPTGRRTDAVTATLSPLGADALDWTAPSVLHILAGGTARLSVTAHNPTDRSVSLSHPLACPLRIDGQELCSDIVQLIGPGQSASATFTIDARGVSPGHYALHVEGVLTISVIVS